MPSTREEDSMYDITQEEIEKDLFYRERRRARAEFGADFAVHELEITNLVTGDIRRLVNTPQGFKER